MSSEGTSLKLPQMFMLRGSSMRHSSQAWGVGGGNNAIIIKPCKLIYLLVRALGDRVMNRPVGPKPNSAKVVWKGLVTGKLSLTDFPNVQFKAYRKI